MERVKVELGAVERKTAHQQVHMPMAEQLMMAEGVVSEDPSAAVALSSVRMYNTFRLEMMWTLC